MCWFGKNLKLPFIFCDEMMLFNMVIALRVEEEYLQIFNNTVFVSY